MFDWPAHGRLLVSGLRGPVQSAVLLAAKGSNLVTAATPEGIVITVPGAAPDSICPTVALTIKGSLTVE